MAEKQILFDAFPKQQQFIEAAFDKTSKYILYGGGIRSGKTFCGLGTLILLCKVYPNTRWAIVRDSLPTLKRNTIPSFNKIVPTNFVKSYNQDTQTVTFTNGSQIIFFAENFDDDKELNRWRGLEVNGFLLEEANELQELSFWKAVERAGSHIPPNGCKKPKPLILMTCNPSWTWVKTLIYDKAKAGTLDPDWKYIPALITDNPFITSDANYMASLKNLPHFQYEVFVKGNWDINLNEKPWLYSYRDSTEAKPHIHPLPHLRQEPIYLAFDFNADPVACTAWQKSNTNGGIGAYLHCVKEFGGAIKIDDLCDRIKTAFPASIFFVCGDRSGQNQDVGRNQTLYQMIQANLGLTDKQMHLNAHNLEHADSRLLCNSVFEHYPVLIDPSCTNLIADCRKATIDPKSVKGNQLMKNRDEYKMDYFDSMRYFMQTYMLKYMRDNHMVMMNS